MRAHSARITSLALLLVLVISGAFAGVPGSSTPAAAAQPGIAPQASASETGRWIVRLDALPLSQAPAVQPERAIMQLPTDTGSKLQLDSAAALQYRQQLQQQQAQFVQTLQQVFPAAQVQRSYQVVFNGVGVALPAASDADIARLRTLPGVSAVYPDLMHRPQMFSSLPQINAPALWENPSIGGQANAGAGIKIAIIDSGIKIDNPFFDPAGYSYPPGFPKGDTAHTTPKVIAARAYFHPERTPLPGSETPQPGPEDSSHGSHVAGTAAGNANTPATFANVSVNISGVAPRAYLMNYKVFYANDSPFSGSGASIEIIAALEDAVLDGADVINNSWGSRASESPRTSPIVQAAEAAVDAGVIVVFSAGNEGPEESTAGAPAYSDRVISVGASTKPQIIASGFVDVVAPEGVPEVLQERPYAPANFGRPIRDEILGPAPYLPVLTLDGTGLACDPLPPGSLGGQVALIERGTCEFGLKVLNAEQAGASAAIIYNSEAGGEELISMAGGSRGGEITIPSIFVQRSLGAGMLNWFGDAGPAARVQIDPQGRLMDNPADVVTEFSSRGPAFQGSLKPDVMAPGANILSAGFDRNAEGLAQHLGFGLNSGTSMAGPHVAGAAALLKQVHPEWGTLDVKSALMSTAALQVWLDEGQTVPASVLDQGAGRIDLARAANPVLLFNHPSLSFGNLSTSVGQPTRREQQVFARNISGEPQTYSLSARPTDGSPMAVSVSPAQLTLGPQESASFSVSIEIPADMPPADYGGLVQLDGVQPLHIPVWARTLPAEPGTKVLLIDNDGSSSLGLQDYSGYYANALLELGISTTYLDVDALAPAVQTLPPIGELQKHEIIIWFTGDNFVPSGALEVPTPLTSTDQNLLIAYLQSGGSLIATGQDLADASDITLFPPDPRYGRSDLYHGYLGARWVQDNVFTNTTSLERVAIGTGQQPWTAAVALDLSAPGAGVVVSDQTGAGNLETIDEITLVDADTRIPDRYTTPIIQAAGAGELGGTIGLNVRDELTLEKPFLGVPYRTTFLSFGLEGVRSDTDMLTRKEFLQLLLYWHVDRPTVSLQPGSTVTTSAPGETVSFTAEATSNTPTTFIRYRWDFGDGSPVVESTEPTVTHTYAQPGTYRAQVEATNSWGHNALSLLDSVEDPPAGDPPAIVTPNTTPPAASEPLTFAETGHTLQGRFLEFWQQNGGLPVFGYPLTPQSDGPPVSQTFERTRLEHHPAHSPPYDVLLGRVGVETLQAQGREWQSFPSVESAPEGCRYFAETRHSLCGAFLRYWESHGLEFDGVPGSSYAESLALFGYPISEPQQETLEDGSVRLVQWFERARFEAHPEAPLAYQVMLGRLAADTVR